MLAVLIEKADKKGKQRLDFGPLCCVNIKANHKGTPGRLALHILQAGVGFVNHPVALLSGRAHVCHKFAAVWYEVGFPRRHGALQCVARTSVSGPKPT